MTLRKLCGGLVLAVAIASAVAPASVRAADTAPSLKVDMNHKLAAFLETREFAAFKGATGEFTKMEGLALDAKNHKLYIAITSIGKTMSDGKGDLQLKENPCGAVYAANLDDNWNVTGVQPVVEGGPYDPSNKENPCPVNSIANPDNISVDPSGNLWIGEDTDAHANNYLWMWNGEELKRFASMPQGAEVAGLKVTANRDIFVNVQHPDATNVYPFNRGTIGVISGYWAGKNFDSLPVPTGDNAKQVVTAAGEYQVLGRMGESIPGAMSNDRFGQYPFADGTSELNNNPDGNMFLPLNRAGTEGYLYSNIESRPGAMSKLYIKKQSKGGWQVIEGDSVDFKSVNGGWNFCNADVTPWNTGLSNEEYEPVVDANWAKSVAPMTRYLGRQANPYDYGYAVEVVPNTFGTTVTKHYTIGRGSHENSTVMPDSKTVYTTDDHDNGVLTKFVADKAGDLSAGTLYAAKFVLDTQANGNSQANGNNQQNGQNQDGKPRFKIQWIELAHGSDKEISAAIRSMDASFVK